MKMEPVVTAIIPSMTLDMGILQNPVPGKPLVAVFRGGRDDEDQPELWVGAIHVTRNSMAEFLNWMENQWNDFRTGKKLGKFYLHGVPIQAEARGPVRNRELWLKIEPLELLRVHKLQPEGDPSQWLDWRMPLERVMEDTHRTLIHSTVISLPAWF